MLPEALIAVREFMQRGGDVLWLILGTLLLMWVLILERLYYFYRVHPDFSAAIQEEWNKRRDRTSWYAKQVRRELIGQVKGQLDQGILMVKTLVALCPLLGLLGTVTGMIEVFEVMALTGSSSARSMASGVSKATIPTMAGMVSALSGLYFTYFLDRFASDEVGRVEDHLTEH